MIKRIPKVLKTFIRNQYVGMLKETVNDKQTREWTEQLNLKLLYCIVFFFVVERVYSWWANVTLEVLMTPSPLVRPEQFTLSLLIHYPQYLLWGVIAGLFAVLVMNFVFGSLFFLASWFYGRMTRMASMDSEPVKSEVPNE